MTGNRFLPREHCLATLLEQQRPDRPVPPVRPLLHLATNQAPRARSPLARMQHFERASSQERATKCPSSHALAKVDDVGVGRGLNQVHHELSGPNGARQEPRLNQHAQPRKHASHSSASTSDGAGRTIQPHSDTASQPRSPYHQVPSRRTCSTPCSSTSFAIYGSYQIVSFVQSRLTQVDQCLNSSNRGEVPTDLLPTGVAAKAVGVGRATLHRWWQDGKVKPTVVTAGGHARWRLSELEQQLRELRRERP